MNVPAIFGGHAWLNTFLFPVFITDLIKMGGLTEASNHFDVELILMLIAAAGAFVAIVFAWFKFVKGSAVPLGDEVKRSFLSNLLYRKYYIDEIYHAIIEKPVLFFSSLFHQIDVYIIANIVNRFGNITVWIGAKSRLLQTGNIGFYLVAMVLSIVAFLVLGLMI